ncbi:hypothetical protein L7F22_034991 [Adiantum nelumboides]|nr:hypothetical protein [Adiantum nelumboides]
MCDKTVQFSVLCSMLDAVARSKKPVLKRNHLRKFLDHVYTDHEFFSALRLILPGLDKERGTYGLKEAVLGKCIADALGLAKESEDAKKLLNWRKGSNAGNFPLVSAEVLYRRQSSLSGNLTIKDVNDYLDKLAAADNRDAKTTIFAELINKTNAHEMRWIVIFILKELKLGISEKTVLHEFHPDAEDLFNVTCDLKLVCEKLKDRNQRFKRQDIVVGKPVRPQLASRVAGVEEAWKKLRGKRIVAECKFDGDRIQIHKNMNEVHFYSRSFIDHKEYTDGMAAVILKQVKIDQCILDGEMLVWNKLTNRFAEFGSNQEVAKAAKDGLETDQQLCFVAFDILCSGDCSVTHQGLAERQILLKKVVQPVRGSLELLLPGSGCGHQDQPAWSTLVHTPEEITKFFLETVENRDEGIVLKDLDSKWEPGDRSGKWIKLKPDYVHAESDLDALVIGCYLGSGRRGGEIGQFLLGLAEKPRQGGHPSRFFSFCKVGSGLSDTERDVLVSKLKPYLREAGRNTKPPSFYIVTNSSKERPDFWVEQPEKSVILEITSDIRTIKSEVFAAPYSLRFPRTNRVRYDKPWYDCLDVDTLVQLVHSRSGNTGDIKEYQKPSKARVARSKKSVPSLTLVPSHMLGTDVSHVKQESSIFKGLVFYFINVYPLSMRDSFHKLIAENGGSFAMNLSDSVTHVIAGERKGLKYQAAASRRDILHQSWVEDSSAQKVLLPLRPKYLLHFMKNSKLRVDEHMDEHGDSYFEDIDTDDLRQLFQHLEEGNFTVGKGEICHFQSKYWWKEGFGQFCGCRIYFHNPIHSSNLDSRMVAEVTLKRLELELLMQEGEVTNKLDDATHMIIYTSTEHPVSYINIIKSVTSENRNLLLAQNMHVVKHSWLEDALASKSKPKEDSYSLREKDVDVLMTPEKDTVTEQLPKLRKRSSFGNTVDGRITEADRSSSKRRLYSAKADTLNCGTVSNAESTLKEGDIQVLDKELNEMQFGTASCEMSCGDAANLTESSPKRSRVSSRHRNRANDDKVGMSAGQENNDWKCVTGSMQCDIFEQEIQKVARPSCRRGGRARNNNAGVSKGEGSSAEDCPASSSNSDKEKDVTSIPEQDIEKVAASDAQSLQSQNRAVTNLVTTAEVAGAGGKKKVSYRELVGDFFDL